MNLNIIREIEAVRDARPGDREKLSVLVLARQELVQTRGARALRAIIDWAKSEIGRLLPGLCVGGLKRAIEQIEMRRFMDAATQITLAAGSLVEFVEYKRLSLQRAAQIACLASALIELSDELNAVRIWQLSAHCNGIMADNAVIQLAKKGGRVDDLVPTLAQVFLVYRAELAKSPYLWTAQFRDLLTENVTPADMPGISLAIWASAHGRISGLRAAIQDGVGMLIVAQTRVFGVGTQRQLLC